METCFSLALSETPKTGSLATRPIYFVVINALICMLPAIISTSWADPGLNLDVRSVEIF